MDISISIELCMGHRLYGYQGKCANLHGHNYNIEFWVNGNPSEDLGLVVDFGDLKSTIKGILDDFDHAMVLMDGDPFEEHLKSEISKHVIINVNPSAENLSSLWYNLCRNEGVRVSKVVVRETSDSCAVAERVDRSVRPLRGLKC